MTLSQREMDELIEALDRWNAIFHRLEVWKEEDSRKRGYLIKRLVGKLNGSPNRSQDFLKEVVDARYCRRLYAEQDGKADYVPLPPTRKRFTDEDGNVWESTLIQTGAIEAEVSVWECTLIKEEN